ncbi:MAG: tRNA adenosine(34) deaminase TadA [Desulfovermiculus sp.]|nr:tRNA adenosine(34) deaminase TadA [Desulfovermiculus sp.]
MSTATDWSVWMHAALEQAGAAEKMGEVPVGAVVLDSAGRFVATGHNSPIMSHDPTAHAEIVALRRAGLAVHNYRLPGSILVSTLEPCIMCVGALVHARIAGVVFGARDPKSGALVSRMRFPDDYPWINHIFWIQEGICGQECENILSRFFRHRRSKLLICKEL